MNYKQCKLRQNDTYDIAWIEERGAKIGNKISLTDEVGWWDVLEVYSQVLTEEQMKNQRDFYRSHRKGTDI